MLCLKRKSGESVVVDGPCKITVIEVHDNFVRLRFTADRDVRILREEVLAKIERESETKQEASGS